MSEWLRLAFEFLSAESPRLMSITDLGEFKAHRIDRRFRGPAARNGQGITQGKPDPGWAAAKVIEGWKRSRLLLNNNADCESDSNQTNTARADCGAGRYTPLPLVAYIVGRLRSVFAEDGPTNDSGFRSPWPGCGYRSRVWVISAK